MFFIIISAGNCNVIVMLLIVNEICTVFHFFPLYFEKIALLLANEKWEIISCILLTVKYQNRNITTGSSHQVGTWLKTNY
jgi:hypothetical protein